MSEQIKKLPFILIVRMVDYELFSISSEFLEDCNATYAAESVLAGCSPEIPTPIKTRRADYERHDFAFIAEDPQDATRCASSFVKWLETAQRNGSAPGARYVVRSAALFCPNESEAFWAYEPDRFKQ